MPILGETRKYQIEQSGKERPARRISLQRRSRTIWHLLADVCAAILIALFLLFLLVLAVVLMIAGPRQ